MRINEIFYSLQGEGIHTGVPSIFIRFAGCNLRCPFCDTDFSAYEELDAEAIMRTIAPYEARRIVLTGGEPSLQVTEAFIEQLHQAGYIVAIETNGTHPLPPGIDWVTLSPKDAFIDTPAAHPLLTECDELKVVFTGHNDPNRYDAIRAQHRLLQPCDTGDAAQNQRITAAAIDYLLHHPAWRLSLQTHKWLNIR